MNPLDKLKHIANNQKTVRTSRLLPLVLAAEKQYIKSGKTIKQQREKLTKIQNKVNQLRN